MDKPRSATRRQTNDRGPRYKKCKSSPYRIVLRHASLRRGVSDHTSTSIVTKMRFFRASLENGGKGGCPLRLPSASSWPAFLATRCGGRESSLEQLISDPIVRAMMDADGVNPHELEAMLRLVAERLRTARRDDEIP